MEVLSLNHLLQEWDPAGIRHQYGEPVCRVILIGNSRFYYIGYTCEHRLQATQNQAEWLAECGDSWKDLYCRLNLKRTRNNIQVLSHDLFLMHKVEVKIRQESVKIGMGRYQIYIEIYTNSDT